MQNLQEGPLPETFTNRRKLIEIIERSGITPAKALQALTDEAAYLLWVRISDIESHAPDESSEAAAIQMVEKSGFDAFDKPKLVIAQEALRNLQDVFKKS